MENLFSTTISNEDKKMVYQIVFNEEEYLFLPQTNNEHWSSFSFKRENDKWKDQQGLAPHLKQQAVDALENYLMAQH